MEEVPLNWWRAAWHPKVPPEFENDRIIDLAEQALVEMVRRDGNHPSLVVWSVANECETADPLGGRAMERLLRRAKPVDPTRLATYVANRAFDQQRAFALADFVAVNLYLGMWHGEVARDLSEIEPRVSAPTRQSSRRCCDSSPTSPS
jgi:beta-glucuronidase